jgi:hypothetical protein
MILLFVTIETHSVRMLDTARQSPRAGPPDPFEEPPVILSISGVVLLGIIAFLFFRKDGLKVSHAVVCALFGFYLAGTAIAPSIKAGGASIASILGGFKF